MMGPIVLSGRNISNLLLKVARTGHELLGIAFVKPAAKNLGLKGWPVLQFAIWKDDTFYLYSLLFFLKICCFSWHNNIWFEVCFQRLRHLWGQGFRSWWAMGKMFAQGVRPGLPTSEHSGPAGAKCIMINIRCTQKQKGVSNHKLLQLQSFNQEKHYEV